MSDKPHTTVHEPFYAECVRWQTLRNRMNILIASAERRPNAIRANFIMNELESVVATEERRLEERDSCLPM